MTVPRGFLILLLALPALAQTPTPVEDLKVLDTPGDDGSGLILTWKKMPYERLGVWYVVEASKDGGPFQEIRRFPSTTQWTQDVSLPFWMWRKGTDRHAVEVLEVGGEAVHEFEEEEFTRLSLDLEMQLDLFSGELKDKRFKVRDVATDKVKRRKLTKYQFRVTTVTPDGKAVSAAIEGNARENLFLWKKANNFVVMILFSGILLVYIQRAKRNPQMFLRRIAGLDAIEEAIGRATEMGRPIYYLTGSYSMTAIQTLASTVILGQVARRVAEYDTQLRIPHRDPVVLTVCQEVVKEAYLSAGRPDAYKEEFNFYLTSDQFSYTAAVDGMMVRERPAAVFYMGYFLAEALLLAEVGATTGAIQVAGTDTASQLPFFVTSCDYTLIGEELYAASAYLSRDPVLVGSLRGQDLGKLITIVVALLASAFALCHHEWVMDLVKGVS